MLHLCNNLGGDGLQTREYRPKCCTFYNFAPQIGCIPPFLLYKIQHSRTLLKNSTKSFGEIFNTAGDDRWRKESFVIGVNLENSALSTR
nr:hypothetical protein [Paenibacillus ginsengihumi]